MRALTYINRWIRKAGAAIVAMVVLGTSVGPISRAASTIPETIQATYSQAGNTIGIKLVVFSYSDLSDLQVLSQAFQRGQDRELATALSKTKAVGRCLIAGGLSYDVAFIQMVLTPTGRQIVFITNRPLTTEESSSPTGPKRFDLAIGQFDLNDSDPAKSTGFLFPSSKLVVDEKGAFHYDLAGTPLALVNVLESNGAPPLTESRVADATGPERKKDRSPSNGR